MEALGAGAKSAGRVYFSGGVTAVLKGWREPTLDIDLKADTEPEGFFEVLAQLKNSLDINVELAAPSDFVPALPGWRERCEFICKRGMAEFFHFDVYSQALSKIERDHERDRGDVERMLSDGLVDAKKLAELFRAVEGELIRYPAVDGDLLKKQVEEFL